MSQSKSKMGLTIETALPQSVQVANAVRTEIALGRLCKGTRLLPTRVLAERFNVSKRVVQSAYEILQREGLVEGRVGQGTFVAYDGRSVAARTVLLALCGLQDEHERLHTLLPDALLEKGFFNCTFDVSNLSKPAHRERLIDALNERPLAFVVDALGQVDIEDLPLPAATRLVFAKHYERPKRIKGASYILVDFEAGSRVACDYLRGRGRQRIVMLNHGHTNGTMYDRQACGCKSVFPGCKEVIPRRMTSDELEQALFDDGPPDGVFCAQDFLFNSVVDLFTQRGMTLGSDYDAVGFHNTPWSTALKIPSMDCRMDLIAAKVAEILETGEVVDMTIVPELRLNEAAAPGRPAVRSRQKRNAARLRTGKGAIP